MALQRVFIALLSAILFCTPRCREQLATEDCRGRSFVSYVGRLPSAEYMRIVFGDRLRDNRRTEKGLYA